MFRLLSFAGRIGRRNYLAATLPLAFAFLVWVAWWLFAISLSETDATIRILRASALGWVVCAWPYFAAGFKRCHDRGKSGVWYLGWTAGCLVCWIAGIVFQSWYPIIAGHLIALWTLVEMGAIKGEAGVNRFGPPPRHDGFEP